jgi:hypothetical protein
LQSLTVSKQPAKEGFAFPHFLVDLGYPPLPTGFGGELLEVVPVDDEAEAAAASTTA